MTNLMKKQGKILQSTVALLLTFCMLLAPSLSTLAADEEIMPLYDNVTSVTTYMNIDSNGCMTIQYNYIGLPTDISHVKITTYIEKRNLFFFWLRTDIGEPNDEWIDTKYQSSYSGNRTVRLTTSGTYRVTVIYEVVGTNGKTETIKQTKTDSF